jgi:hypothetical protein
MNRSNSLVRGVFVVLSAMTIVASPASVADPFAFFRPSITVSADDRRELERGMPIARVVRGTDGEVGVFAAVHTNIDGDQLVAWTREIEALKKGPYVLAIGRFSDPPTIEDVGGLTLDDEELLAIRRCRRGDCDVKLTGAEMDRLRQTVVQAGDDWKPALQDAFRLIVLQRVEGYLVNGHEAFSDIEDKDRPLSLGTQFSTLLSRSFLAGSAPLFAKYLDTYPRTPISDIESFVYWSKERFDGKAIISATHVSVLRSSDMGMPDALIAGKGIFATHYVNASLGLTGVIRGRVGSPNYLAYFNRSDIDIVGGVFGGLVRSLVERRLKKEASTVLLGVRQRLEGGEPESSLSQLP